MADRGSCGLGPRLDMQQLFLEAQHRWLRPAEICEILRNYQKFQISAEPPNRPPSGSLFLFDRKVLRYFRKDGHNWRKKKDGKTVKEAHEKLKVGSVDVLHCYYAHGEENENFQRRSYWMLEQELMHIVFVHYLEVKGNRTSNSPSNSFAANHVKETSGNTDSTSPTSTLSSLCEDADSADSHQASSRSSPESSQLQSNPLMGQANASLLRSHFLHPGSDNHGGRSSIPGGPISFAHGDKPGDNGNVARVMEYQSLGSWEEVLAQCTAGYNDVHSHASTDSTRHYTAGFAGNMVLGEVLAGGVAVKDQFDGSRSNQSNWQIPDGNSSLHLPEGPMDPTLSSQLGYDFGASIFQEQTNDVHLQNPLESLLASIDSNDPLLESNLQMQLTDLETQLELHSNSENDLSLEGSSKYPFIVRKPLLDGEESLKKVDSFSRWVSKELAEVDDLNMKSSSGLSWSTVECGNAVDDSSLSPSLSQDQLFSIVDFSPKWACADSETEVHIVGTFLKSQQEVLKCKWSCMFGEVEVPAEILVDGVLCCYAPPHNVARVPFYVTCSNRLACSEVRDFDYCAGSAKGTDVSDVFSCNTIEMHLYLRLEKLLSLRSSSPSNHQFGGAGEIQKLIIQIISLKEDDESYQTSEAISEKDLLTGEMKRQLLQKLIKEKLYSWLLHKVAESDKGPSILDDEGQGVLHLAAALGCDWAIEPTVRAGVSINFRDVNGWTALHWAACYGREDTVAVLVTLDADSGALTDPTPEYPLGRTPADIASDNGHKGISGFLAESSLTSYLEKLGVNDPQDGSSVVPGNKAVQTISERTATPVNHGDVFDDLPLKDSLTAIRNAEQAASRIHQVFRMQSFQRKKLSENDDEFGISNERVLSILAAKTGKPGHSDGIAHAAAIQIQKKFRGWKKRKEFLIIRQRIVKIQAHVRGHQVRKQYRTIVWSVGILEKVILRWRRKGSGLRGFRRDALTRDSSPQCMPPEEDAYDFLKEGRKQNEERQQKALTRVKSMFQYPEGRAQYRRLLTVLEGYRENKASDMVVSSSNETAEGDDDLTEFDSFMDDETFMSIAFE